MRILFLSNFYPPHDYGGYEQWCHEVATGLQERGHIVAVLTSRYRVAAVPDADEPQAMELHLETDLDFFITRWIFCAVPGKNGQICILCCGDRSNSSPISSWSGACGICRTLSRIGPNGGYPVGLPILFQMIGRPILIA